MDDPRPLLVDTGRGFSLQYKNRLLYSRYHPAKSAEQVCSTAAIFPETLYLLYSPCLCYGIQLIAERLPPDSTIIAVEADEQLMRVAIENSAELRGRFPALHLIRCDSSESLIHYYRQLGPHKRLIPLVLSGGYEMHRAVYEKMASALGSWLATQSRNRIAAVRMGRLWLRNTISNLANMRWDQVLPNYQDKRPVLIAGAGPSLKAALPFIRQMQDTFHVMACDTAIGPLAAAACRIDSVICLEGQIHNLHDFLPLSRRPVLLFSDISAHPSGFREIDGNIILLASSWTENHFLKRLAELGLPLLKVPPLGSVGVLALHLAIQLFTGPIYIAGLDFSYTPGQTHCPGSPIDYYESGRENRLYRRAWSWQQSYGSQVQKLADGQLGTPVLSMYAGMARELISGLQQREPDRPVYDLRGTSCTELGALRLKAPDFSLPEPQTSDSGIGQTTVELAGKTSDRIYTTRSERASTLAPAWQSVCTTFLQNELELIQTLRKTLRGEDSGRDLSELTSELDYLYSHFPDAERVKLGQLDALKRLAAEAAYWEGRLQAALSAARPA